MSFSFRTHQLDCAKLVIKLQWPHLDADLGNGGWMRREASAKRLVIGRSAGIEFGSDGLGELGLAGAIVSKRRRPDRSGTGLQRR